MSSGEFDLTIKTDATVQMALDNANAALDRALGKIATLVAQIAEEQAEAIRLRAELAREQANIGALTEAVATYCRERNCWRERAMQAETRLDNAKADLAAASAERDMLVERLCADAKRFADARERDKTVITTLRDACLAAFEPAGDTEAEVKAQLRAALAASEDHGPEGAGSPREAGDAGHR